MIVTLVIRHPGRPGHCFERTVRSLLDATEREHLIDIRVQGRVCRAVEELHACFGTAPRANVRLSITAYGEHVYTARPRIESARLALGRDAAWWAKLDDDITLPRGAWDRLIAAIEHARAHRPKRPAAAMASPRTPGLEDRAPRLFAPAGAVLGLLEGSSGSGEGEGYAYQSCEFVGDGCTVFDTAVFREGFAFDEGFRLGGADIDLCWQLYLGGYEVLLCDPPAAQHRHRDCSPEEYDRMRYDASMIAASSRHFRAKWGMTCAQLAQFERRAQ